MDCKNKVGGNINIELMPFKKFVEAYCKDLGVYQEDTIHIRGTFKERETNIICDKDIFVAHKIGKSLESTYKAYLRWFNYTGDENERIFVSVKLERSK